MRSGRGQSGQIVYVSILIMILLIAVPYAFQLAQTSQAETRRQETYTAQAHNVARAGLIDAISWFRRQSVQPVRSSFDVVAYPYPDAAFKPVQSTDTVTTDTLDASIGLVKEYEVSENGNIWGRYEIWRQSTGTALSYASHDVTDKRIENHSAGEGLAWYVESLGYVYRRNNAGVAYNVAPNQIIGRARVATEIRRLALSLPVNAAVICNQRNALTVQSNGRVIGGTADAGYGYYYGTTAPSVSGSGSQLSGNPSQVDIDGPSVSTGSISVLSIFGVNASDIRLMADYNVKSAAELPTSYPTMAIVYVNGNTTFDSSHRLKGGGILFVNGNLTIDDTSNTLFSGIIYATGNVLVEGPALISGSLLASGTVRLTGVTDVAQVEYDANLISSVRQQICQYREYRSNYYNFTAVQ